MTCLRARQAKPRAKGRSVLASPPATAPLAKKGTGKQSKAPRKEPRDTSWWIVWPDIYKQEISAFDRLGISYQIKVKKKGILILEADWPIEGQDPLHLEIGFSPMHPFCRPAVAAPEQSFERHQHPLSKGLCLLTQEVHQWNSLQNVAYFIDERLQQFLAALEARRQGRWEDAAELEEQSADPLMPYFADVCEESSVILFDGEMELPSSDFGLMDIALSYQPFPAENGQSFQATIQRLNTVNGILIRNFKLPAQSDHQHLITGRWIRLDRPPFTDDSDLLLATAEAELKKLSILQPEAISKINELSKESLSITGIVYPEEVEYGQGRTGVGWIFIVGRQNFIAGGLGSLKTSLARGERVGEQEIFARLPVARSLRGKKVFLVGCGAIGSFAAVELARAGVGSLRLFDKDVVQPGNSLRWPLGRTAWGLKKSVALADFIIQNYPWTKVSAMSGSLGGAVTNETSLPSAFASLPASLDQIRGLIQEADLIIDATASTEVQHTLAYHCRDLNKPFIIGYATEGLAGGIVARFQPNSEICWVCVNKHWKDRTLPELRVDKNGVLTPIGCNQPTFTGGGFDLQEVSLEIVRSAVGILSNGAYDPGGWSVAILELLDDDGHRLLPRWTEHALPPHPDCCGSDK